MTLKVLSYNIREGGDGRLEAIAGIIRKERPDAVALVEVCSRPNVELLARDLEMELCLGEANNGYHVAWLTCQPVRRLQNHRLPLLAKTLLEIELVHDGAPLHLFATHLAASRWDGHEPLDEVPTLLAVLLPVMSRPHLLVGDFNALRLGDPVGSPPLGEEKRGDALDGAPRQTIRLILEAGYVDCFRDLHPVSPGYTYPSHHPWLRLDYVFASPAMAMRLSACDVVQGELARQASDHFPLWAQFR